MNANSSFDPSLRTLFLAAEGPTVWVGFAEHSQWVRRIEKTGGAVEDFFPAVDEVLAGEPIDSVKQIVYTPGPGNLLGLRTLSAAIRTWALLFPEKGFFRMSGMVWTARRLLRQSNLAINFHLLAPARSGFWNVLHAQSNHLPSDSNLRLEPEEVVLTLAAPLYLLPHRTLKQLPRQDLIVVEEDYADLPGFWDQADLIHPASGELLLHETQDFQKWTPSRHR